MLDRPTRRESPAPPSSRRADLRRERSRRHRQRIKQGKMVVAVELDGQVMDYLVSVHWLTAAEADAGDARVIGQAIARGLEASAKG